jgi:pyruvate carboxylase
VARAYAEVNDMFGDIIKVTPTSKVVGDMAILMVMSGLTRAAVLDPNTDIAFPESVVRLFRGDVGQPYGGFPEGLQRKVLKGAAPRKRRAGEEMPPADFEQLRIEANARAQRVVTDQQFASYLMCSPTLPPIGGVSATSRFCPRRYFSTAWSLGRRSASISSAARP